MENRYDFIEAGVDKSGFIPKIESSGLPQGLTSEIIRALWNLCADYGIKMRGNESLILSAEKINVGLFRLQKRMGLIVTDKIGVAGVKELLNKKSYFGFQLKNSALVIWDYSISVRAALDFIEKLPSIAEENGWIAYSDYNDDSASAQDIGAVNKLDVDVYFTNVNQIWPLGYGSKPEQAQEIIKRFNRPEELVYAKVGDFGFICKKSKEKAIVSAAYREIGSEPIESMAPLERAVGGGKLNTDDQIMIEMNNEALYLTVQLAISPKFIA